MVNYPASAADTLQIYTEVSPPYQYAVGDRVEGSATEKVRAIVAKAGFESDIKLYPWARALLHVERSSRALIYSMARKADRVHHYQWIAPVATFHLAIITLAQRHELKIDASQIPDIYTASAQRGDFAVDWLTNKGFREGDNLILCADIICSWQQLKLGTVDFILEDPELIADTAKLVGLQGSDIKVQQIIPELAIEAYLAANKNMSEQIVSQLQQAAKELGYRE